MIGDMIKRKRLENGWTQEELAKRMGYKSKSTINKIELGINDVNQQTIVKFAKVLGTSIPYLMEYEETVESDVEFSQEFGSDFSLDRKKIWLEVTKGQSLNDEEFAKLIEYLKFIVSQRGK